MNLKSEKKEESPLDFYQYKLKTISYLGLSPGDLVSFVYGNSSRFGLVVSSRRAAKGLFLSTRNNRLLNIVELKGLSDDMFSLMVNNLYKNRNACNYHSPNIIGAFLGKDNFKTFNIAKLNKLLSYEIGKQ